MNKKLSERVRKPEKGVWSRYEVDYQTGKVTFKNKRCPRCKKTMARHDNPSRWACGGCGYMEYIKKAAEKT